MELLFIFIVLLMWAVPVCLAAFLAFVWWEAAQQPDRDLQQIGNPFARPIQPPGKSEPYEEFEPCFYEH